MSAGMFHINNEGAKGTCGAEQVGCPFRNNFHGSESQVDNYISEQGEKEHGIVTTVTKNDNAKPVPTPLVKPSPDSMTSPKVIPAKTHKVHQNSSQKHPGRRSSNSSNTKNSRMSKQSPTRGRVPGALLVFHKDIGFPKGFPVHKLKDLRVPLSWSSHALEEAEKDRYGDIKFVSKLDGSQWEPIEIKLNKTDGKLNRILFRGKPDSRGLSTCLVVAPDRRDPRKWTVITAWLNEANDSHKTLDRRRYDDPNNF